MAAVIEMRNILEGLVLSVKMSISFIPEQFREAVPDEKIPIERWGMRLIEAVYNLSRCIWREES